MEALWDYPCGINSIRAAGNATFAPSKSAFNQPRIMALARPIRLEAGVLDNGRSEGRNEMLTNPGRHCRLENCPAVVPHVLERERLCIDHHLEESFQKLAVATAGFHREGGVNHETMDWLLGQVDFAVEALGQEDNHWDSDQRSRLLELLLGVANLNEYVRHSVVSTPQYR
jgi:hypothetical protein